MTSVVGKTSRDVVRSEGIMQMVGTAIMQKR